MAMSEDATSQLALELTTDLLLIAMVPTVSVPGVPVSKEWQAEVTAELRNYLVLRL